MKYCLHCNSELIQRDKEKPSDFKTRKFCNMSCSSTYNNKHYPRKRRQLEYKPTVQREPFKVSSCNCCKTEIILELLGDKRHYSTKQFCDNCRDKQKGSQKRIKPETRTKGELFSVRCNWQSARTSIRNNAVKVLGATGLTKECKICGYTNHVEVCHLKSVADFSSDTLVAEINHQDNLVYLCPNHHWEFDNGLLDVNKNC